MSTAKKKLNFHGLSVRELILQFQLLEGKENKSKATRMENRDFIYMPALHESIRFHIIEHEQVGIGQSLTLCN